MKSVACKRESAFVPTMKPLDKDKTEKAETKAEEKSVEAAPIVEEKIDFSNVEIEPLFQDQVDFDTFSKSDFRAVKVKECEAVKKSKKLYERNSLRWFPMSRGLKPGTGKSKRYCGRIMKMPPVIPNTATF